MDVNQLVGLLCFSDLQGSFKNMGREENFDFERKKSKISEIFEFFHRVFCVEEKRLPPQFVPKFKLCCLILR